MTEEQFIEELKKINITITKEQLSKLSTYASFLQEYNTHTNLTTITETKDIYLKHFYDSLTITKYIDLTKYNTLLDIGTGAGFPGLVLKIVFPHLSITLLDSNNKKITFLHELSNKLNIQLELIHSRAEEYIKNKRESFDIVTSRAVASLPVLAELSLPFVKINGYFLSLKGSAEEEIKSSQQIIPTLGGKITKVDTFLLPKEQSTRTIIIVEKTKNTPLQFPRPYNKIIKNTLKKN